MKELEMNAKLLSDQHDFIQVCMTSIRTAKAQFKLLKETHLSTSNEEVKP